jgi:hypothetical protein
MLSEEFGTLLAEHPRDANVVKGLAEYLSGALSRPRDIIDERIVATTLHAPLELIERMLIELVALDVVDTMFFWLCPNAGGTAWQGHDIKDAPPFIRCNDCLNIHYLDEGDVVVHFRPSANALANATR